MMIIPDKSVELIYTKMNYCLYFSLNDLNYWIIRKLWCVFNLSAPVTGRTFCVGNLLEWANLDLFRGVRLGLIFNKYSVSN